VVEERRHDVNGETFCKTCFVAFPLLQELQYPEPLDPDATVVSKNKTPPAGAAQQGNGKRLAVPPDALPRLLSEDLVLVPVALLPEEILAQLPASTIAVVAAAAGADDDDQLRVSFTLGQLQYEELLPRTDLTRLDWSQR
jgi:hypothetical protein